MGEAPCGARRSRCCHPVPRVRYCSPASANEPPRSSPLLPPEVAGVTWWLLASGEQWLRGTRVGLCVSESPGRFVTYADVQASYRYKPNQWSYFKQFCKPYVNSPHKVRMWHCYNHIKGIPGSDLTVSRTGFQRDFRVYLQLRQTWAWLKSVLNSTANSEITKYPFPWSFV
ncbi:choline transporter-like protein 5-A [Lathamus discolor]|uniref:choline transporter-like protein 5-A n=1 Tax=Lathamus discolor TaxID=678569 RepID=UPI0032B78966